MVNAPNLMLFALIAVIIAFIIGILLAALVLGGRRTERERAAALANTPAPDEPIPSPDPHLAMVRLWRDAPGSPLVVEYDGRLISSPQDLSPEQRKEIEMLSRDWLAWQGLISPARPAAPRAASPSAPAAPFITPETSAAINPAPASAAAQPPVKPTGMVAEIDEILQEQLANSPLAEHGVHLTEDPQYGVIVWVGALRFNGIDAVSDPEVQRALRAAAREWERRHAKA